MAASNGLADDSRGGRDRDLAPPVYRVGTLSREQDVLAVAQTATQRRSSAMLDPFSPGSVRKWSSDPLLKQENRALARFSRAL